MTGENLKRLDAWYGTIKPYKELTIDEARRLNDRIRKLPPNREQLMEELVLGTMHVVYSYLKKFSFINFASGSHDIDDLIDSFCEVWIENLEIGLYKRTSFSTMFNSKFFDKVNEKLGISEKCLMFPHIKRLDFDDIFFDFFDLKNSGEEINYDYFMKNIEKNNNMRLSSDSTKHALLYEYTQFYNLLNKCYDIYSIYGSNDISFSKGYVKFLRDFLIEAALDSHEDSYNVGYEHGGYELAVEKEKKETIRKTIGSLNEFEEQVLLFRLGFDGDEALTQEQVSKRLSRLYTRQMIAVFEKTAIKKMRHPRRKAKLKDYYE